MPEALPDLSGPIRPIDHERRIDRADERHPLWLAGADPAAPRVDAWDTAPTLDLTGATRVIAALSPEAPAALVAALVAARGRKYALVATPPQADGWDDMLVRVGPAVPLDWLVTDGGAAGWVAFGPGDTRTRIVRLQPSQARALFEAFHHLFWREASQERLPGGRWQAPLGPPDGVAPAAPRRRLGDVQLAIGDGFDAPLEGAIAVGDGPRAPIRLVPPGAPVAAGEDRVWTDLGLPDLASTPRGLVTEHRRGRLQLRLQWPTGAAIAVHQALGDVARRPTWRLVPDARLGDAGALAWRCGQAKAEPVHDERDVRLDAKAPVPLADVAGWTSPPPTIRELSRAIRVRSRVVPETPPVGARDHELVVRWRALDDAHRSGVDALRKALDEGAPTPPLDGQRRGLIARLTDASDAPPTRRDGPEAVAELRRLDADVRAWIDAVDAHAAVVRDEAVAAAQAAAEADPKASRARIPPLATRRRPPKLDVPDAPPAPLPSVGRLLDAGGTSLLAVATWEDARRAAGIATPYRARVVALAT